MTNTNSVQNVINEVLATRGATVSVFGQPHKIGESVEKGYVDIIEILEGFKGYEAETVLPAQYQVSYNDELEEYTIIDSNGEIIEDAFTDEGEAEERMYELQEENAAPVSVEEYMDYMDELGYLEEKSADNSYNWLGNVSNHFNFRTYEHIDGSFYVEFKVHLYGDVRANYTDSVLLKFDDEHDFLQAISECDSSEDYKGYTIHFSALSEGYEILDAEGWTEGEKYSWEDVIEYIDGLVEEEISEEV